MLKNLKVYAGLLAVMNIIPLLGAYVEVFRWHDIAYFYWGETVLLGLLAVFMFAKPLLVFFLLLGMVGLIFQMLGGDATWQDMKIPLTFWLIYCLCWLGYIEMGKTRYWLQARRLHPGKQFFIYLTFMAIAIFLSFIATATVYGAWDIVPTLPLEFFLIFFTLAICVPTAAIGFLKVIDMIGSRHFVHFLIGTYYRPVERDKIVMFIDMVNSSGIAEKLTAKDSMRLVANFIFDASAIIRSHGGDILNYTGDGLVVIWPRKQGERALNAVYALRARIRMNRREYIKEFNLIPDFRIGIHAGEVVISQVGEEKLFLGLYGDVVNTAARLEQLNKKLGTKVLLSDAVIAGMNQNYLVRLKPLGPKAVRGREEKVEVFTLKERATD